MLDVTSDGEGAGNLFQTDGDDHTQCIGILSFAGQVTVSSSSATLSSGVIKGLQNQSITHRWSSRLPQYPPPPPALTSGTLPNDAKVFEHFAGPTITQSFSVQ